MILNFNEHSYEINPNYLIDFLDGGERHYKHFEKDILVAHE